MCDKCGWVWPELFLELLKVWMQRFHASNGVETLVLTFSKDFVGWAG